MESYFRFLLLPPEAKLQYLRDNGTFLLEHPVDGWPIRLYALSDFFVELSYQEENQVGEVAVFKGTKRLQRYLTPIDLKDLTGQGD